MSPKNALILGPGALCGAYGAGVASVLGCNISFHKVYGCSVGVFAATFLVTKQFDIMLDVWRNHVHGKLLINLMNPVRGRSVLDLEYLTDLFRKNGHILDLDKTTQEKGKLAHVLTHCSSGKPEYFHPTGENIFYSMMASSAVPYVHPKIKINGQHFYDGGLSDPYPLLKAIEDGADQVVVVSNFSKEHDGGPVIKFSRLASRAAKKSEEGLRLVEVQSKDSANIVLVRPSHQILRGMRDTNKDRINATIDQGIEDAQIFLKEFREFNF